jgi:protein-S-isoprenylcysteine O-methyltransferase Ste14
MIVRTALEDKTLQDELPGYKEFTQKTKYRLFPGLW